MNETGVRPAAAFPFGDDEWGAEVHYGPHAPPESKLRLLGPVAGRRILVLGAGAGQLPAALARSGAKVIVVEPDPVALALVRDHGSEHGLTIETHDRDLAELAFVRAGTVDVALAVQSLVRVADPSRVFRQLHRVLRPDAALVASLPHPMRPVLGPPRHRYGQASPQRIVVASGRGDIVLQAHHHTTEALVAGLLRTNFALDALLEPVPDRPSAPDAYWDPACEGMPSALIVRARRLGR